MTSRSLAPGPIYRAASPRAYPCYNMDPCCTKMSTTNMSPGARFAVTIVFLLQLSAPSVNSAYAFNKNAEYNHPKDMCACMIGPPGAPGTHGIPGHHGDKGPDGRPGLTGDKGGKGDTGWKGDAGPLGPEGPTGKRGRKGVAGDDGAKGDGGIKGQKGERGYTGMMGEKGIKGDPAGPGKRVAFSVATSQRLGPVLQDTPVTFDVVFSNIGESFDSYSSQFICKTNGTYIFMTHILGQNNKDVYAWIMMNDKHKVPLHGDGRAGYGTGSQTIILKLKADDRVWIQLSKDSGLLNDYTTFTGYLLFEDIST